MKTKKPITDLILQENLSRIKHRVLGWVWVILGLSLLINGTIVALAINPDSIRPAADLAVYGIMFFSAFSFISAIYHFQRYAVLNYIAFHKWGIWWRKTELN